MRLVAMLVLTVGLACGGCVERRLKLESDPPGALVFLNGEEVARTPAIVPLEWYGKYDITVRKEGFETLDEERWVVAPPWLWVPFDFVAELLPLRLTHTPTLRFTMKDAVAGEEGLIDRATTLRNATTRPAD